MSWSRHKIDETHYAVILDCPFCNYPSVVPDLHIKQTEPDLTISPPISCAMCLEVFDIVDGNVRKPAIST